MNVLKTIQTLTLATLLVLALGACSNKDNNDANTTEQTTSTTTSTSGGSTDETNDSSNENTSTENNETNPVDVNTTATLKSLTLTLAKSTLNKDETTDLSLQATYTNSTSKTLTSNIEWIVSPSNAVQITDHTLTAKKDSNVTLQAKVGNTLSNTIALNITWVVNGHVLPPEPDKALNDSTLLGIDTNNNGVRDDVERWIYDRYKDEHPIMIPLKMQAARAFRYIIQDPSQARERDKAYINASNCEQAFGAWANAFGRKPLFEKESEISIKEGKEMEYVQFNTTQRARAYGLYNQNLSGMVFDGEWPSEKWIENCDFNTSKYIEMSEKL